MEIVPEEFEKVISTQQALDTLLELPTGVRIAAKIWGPHDSKVKVLAVHGWMDNANTFDLVAPFLAAHGVRVVCLDLVGHGKSPHIGPSSDYFYYEYLCTIVDTATTLGWKHFSYMGHSMGGALGVVLAAAMPDLIDRLVLFDTLGPYIPSNTTVLSSITTALQTRPRNFGHKPILYASTEAAGDKLRKNNDSISDRGIKILIERAVYNVTLPNGASGVMYRHDPRIRHPSPIKMQESDALDMIKSLKCPTLIFGSKASFLFQGNTERYKTRIELFKKVGAEIVLVDGSHHLHLDNPEAFAFKMLYFMNQLSPPKANL